MTFPLKYVHGNLLFGHDGECAALYRVNTASYPFLADDAKVDWFSKLLGFAHKVEADFSMWRVCRRFDPDAYVENAMGMLDPAGNAESWRAFLEGHRERLAGMDAFVPELYLAVSLVPPRRRSDTITAVSDAIHARIRRVRRHHPPIATAEIERYVQLDHGVLNRAAANLPIRRATTREIQWLLRRAAVRGVTEPMIDRFWTPAAMEINEGEFQPLETDVWRHANPPITEEDRSLVVDGEEIRTHQAMLALGALPGTAEFPGGTELLCTPLEATPFPVDAVIHVRWIANRDATQLVARRVLDADNAYTEQATSAHGALSFVVEENRVLVRQLDSEMRSPARPPLLRATIGFAVGASTREELEHRVEVLRHRYGLLALHRPLGLQRALFLDHLPRADGGTIWDYQDYLTVRQFAALMPIGTHHTGSMRGVYIGHVAGGGRRPVLHDVTAASREGRPPSILLIGSLGSGKTITAELVAYQAWRRNSVVVDVDPKPDHNLEGVPEMRDDVSVIELSGDPRYRGLLDPLVIAPEMIREDLTNAYLMDLVPHAPPSWETQIRKAVQTVLATDAPSCLAVIDTLARSANEDAHRAADALGVWADSGIARLGFSNGHARTVTEVARRVTTIKASGLALPDADVPRSEYDLSERVAVATLKLVAAFAMRLVQGNRSQHKLVLFDEAWFLLGSQSGRRLLERLNRMGRAENATLLLVTQRFGEVGDIEALIGTRIVCRAETVTEARIALQLLGLDPDDRRLVERVRAYRAGMCMVRDIYNQIAEVQVDVLPRHLLDIWDTTPGAERNLVAA